eukprot:764837-Hanusia_phi.AAC.2
MESKMQRRVGLLTAQGGGDGKERAEMGGRAEGRGEESGCMAGVRAASRRPGGFAVELENGAAEGGRELCLRASFL